MAMRRSNHLRGPDFNSPIWFLPTHQGGLTRTTYYKSMKSLKIGINDDFWQAFLTCADEWIIPGQGHQCGIYLRHCKDEHRRQFEIGQEFELFIKSTDENVNEFDKIGLGRIAEVTDPHRRSFVADAKIKVHFSLNPQEIDEWKGVPLKLRFERLDRDWHGHICTGQFEDRLLSESEDAWLCFYDLWQSKEFPENGHPILAGDQFKIVCEEQEIGTGEILEWIKRRHVFVCYPKGWRAGCGVTWRKSWSA